MPQISPHDSLDEEEAGPSHRSPRKKKRVAGTPKNLKKEGGEGSNLNLKEAFRDMIAAEEKTAEKVCLP